MDEVLTAETIRAAVRLVDEAGYHPPSWYQHPDDQGEER